MHVLEFGVDDGFLPFIATKEGNRLAVRPHARVHRAVAAVGLRLPRDHSLKVRQAQTDGQSSEAEVSQERAGGTGADESAQLDAKQHELDQGL